MSEGKTNDGNNKEGFNPLVMFPSSKNFKIEDEKDPLKDLLNEFTDHEESYLEDEHDEIECCNFDPDKTYVRTIPELDKRNSKDLIGLLEEFHFYLSEIDQYWHE